MLTENQEIRKKKKKKKKTEVKSAMRSMKNRNKISNENAIISQYIFWYPIDQLTLLGPRKTKKHKIIFIRVWCLCSNDDYVQRTGKKSSKQEAVLLRCEKLTIERRKKNYTNQPPRDKWPKSSECSVRFKTEITRMNERTRKMNLTKEKKKPLNICYAPLDWTFCVYTPIEIRETISNLILFSLWLILRDRDRVFWYTFVVIVFFFHFLFYFFKFDIWQVCSQFFFPSFRFFL